MHYALYMCDGSLQIYLLMHVLQLHRQHAPVLAGRFKAAKLWPQQMHTGNLFARLRVMILSGMKQVCSYANICR